MTRVAGANARIWVDIFLDNREALLAALAEHRRAPGRRHRRRSRPATAGSWRAGSASRPPRAGARDAAAYPEADGDLHTVQRAPRRPPRLDRRHHAGPRRRARSSIRDLALRHSLHGGRRLPRDRRGRRRAPPTEAVEILDAQGYAAIAAPVEEDRGSERRSDDHWDVEPAAGAARASCRSTATSRVSHRSLLLGARLRRAGRGRAASAPATTRWPRSRAVRALGVQVDEAPRRRAARCTASGCAACAEPDGVIDVHNAGTLLRLLPGLLAGQPARPLHARRRRLDPPAAGRIASPTRCARWAPTSRHATACRRCSCAPARRCTGIEYELPVASAQVKSCVLLAGLFGRGADDRRSSRAPAATTPSGCCRPPACASSAAPAA